MKYVGSIDNDAELILGTKKILIYGTGRYGERVYRNLMETGRNKDVVAFLETSPGKGKLKSWGGGIPVIGLESARELYENEIVCVSGKYVDEMKKSLAANGMNNIHHIDFLADCERWGTAYGGFHVPLKCNNADSCIVYSFGIGEDLSFSQEAIRKGAEVYAFDPTPRAIAYVKNSELSLHPRFHFYPIGLSGKNEKANFYLPVNPDYVSCSAVLHKAVDERRPIEVEMKTLKVIMQEIGHKKIDILKMDIEGSEFDVIKNIVKVFGNFMPFTMLCMETHERFFEDKTVLDQLYVMLQENGYYDRYGLVEEPTFVRCRCGDKI